MAVTTNYGRQLLSTTNETIIWTAGANGGVLTNLVICNVTGSAATITITLNDANTNKIALVSGYSIAAYNTVTFDIKQVLGANKNVYATAGTGNALAVHASGVSL